MVGQRIGKDSHLFALVAGSAGGIELDPYRGAAVRGYGLLRPFRYGAAATGGGVEDEEWGGADVGEMVFLGDDIAFEGSAEIIDGLFPQEDGEKAAVDAAISPHGVVDQIRKGAGRFEWFLSLLGFVCRRGFASGPKEGQQSKVYRQAWKHFANLLLLMGHADLPGWLYGCGQVYAGPACGCGP